MIKVIDEPSILSATEIKIAEGLQPHRLVLRKVDGPHPYSVHRENLSYTMNVFEHPQVLTFTHQEFYWGEYFTSLEAAEKSFYTKNNSI